MRWRKLGQVFDPRAVTLPHGCREWAQSPQVLAVPDGLRVYFSTRSVDPANGKFRTRVAYADMDRSLRSVQQVSSHEVLPLGQLGAFDEHGIFPFSVLRHDDEVWSYTTGWSRRASVSVETAIGLAVSRDDGRTFARLGPGPVMAASLDEPYLVGDAYVRQFGGQWHMWYIFGTDWTAGAPGAEPERTYKIGHAVSPDGIVWERDGRAIIADHLGPAESQALPSVVVADGVYHMAFCYRETFDFRRNPERAYRVGHAVSTDLRTWTRLAPDPLSRGQTGEWDADMQCYPHLFTLDGEVFLLYNGNEFGRFGFGAAVLEP